MNPRERLQLARESLYAIVEDPCASERGRFAAAKALADGAIAAMKAPSPPPDDSFEELHTRFLVERLMDAARTALKPYPGAHAALEKAVDAELAPWLAKSVARET